MNISATRKVGGSTSASRTERNYAAGHPNSQFVENIDTRNNVLVRDDTDGHSNKNSYNAQKEGTEKNTEISPSVAYVKNSIEALAVSGVFDEKEDEEQDKKHAKSKVGVYDNNQSIIRDEELERTGRNYLKHFYEKNEHLVDVDELI